jgi:hypothetical protein
MRRIFILAGVIGIVILNLALLRAAVVTAARNNASVDLKPGDNGFSFTKIVTLTVSSSGGPITSSPNVFWQTSYISFPISYQPPTPTLAAFGPPDIPLDAQNIVITVEGGVASIEAPVIHLTLTQDVVNIYYEFSSNSVYRTGSAFKIGQTQSSNHPYHFIGTIFYTDPYQYAGYISTTPSSVVSYTVLWDLIPLTTSTPNGDRWRVYPLIWLNDPRIPPTLVYLPLVLKSH